MMRSSAPSPVTAPVRTGSVQGSFFAEDPYPRYGDTAPTPVVPMRQQQLYQHIQQNQHTRQSRQSGQSRQNHGKPRGSLGLRIAVAVTALAVVAAATALGLVRAGVIHTGANSNQSGHAAVPPAATHQGPAHTSSLLTQTDSGAGNANFTVNASTFALNIETSRRTWVSVGPVGQNPTFAGILDASSSKHLSAPGPTQLEIGAGGSTVVVTANHKSQTLTPPSAPFTYQFTPS
jgi:hypothetical protein